MGATSDGDRCWKPYHVVQGNAIFCANRAQRQGSAAFRGDLAHFCHLVLQAEAVAALLMVTITGILRAIVMNNGSGGWDNAQKYIEKEGVYGGKSSESYRAAVSSQVLPLL
jgi:hypothetical protein